MKMWKYSFKEVNIVSCVIKEWMYKLDWKRQTVVLLALRGPDVGASIEFKPIVRFIRSVTLKNADPDKDFMKDVSFSTIKEILAKNPFAIDQLTSHFIHHLNLALMVIGYDHPSKLIRDQALEAYRGLGHALCFKPLDYEDYLKHLKDNRGALKLQENVN